MTTATNAPKVSVRAPDPATQGTLRVSSKSFTEGGVIAPKHADNGCGGKNSAPQLSWAGAPNGTKSFAITCFDPDAPTGAGYWHWVAFNIAADIASLDEGEGNGDSPGGGGVGFNDSGRTGYAGPCPPPGDGEHHYTFTVYALDVGKIAGASAKTTGAALACMLRGHVLAQGSITGRLER